MPVKPAAQTLIAKLNKQYGPGSVILASEMLSPNRFTSGSLSLDISLGGGWPANQWVEIVGLEQHGKTAITLKTIAANQRANPDFVTLWIAGEHYDADQAAALGVDNARIILEPSIDLEVIYDSILLALEDRAVDCVVIDSYPALVSPEENSGEMGDLQVAAGARMTGKFFRKMGAAGRRNPADPEDAPWFGIFINQYRDVIGWAPTGSKGTTPGGKAKNYAFYQRVDIARVEFIEEKTEGKGTSKVGQVIRTKAFKNKGGPPQRVGSIDFYFTDAPGKGFERGDYDLAKEAFIMGALYDVIERKGAWYHYGSKKWNGTAAALHALGSDPDLINQIDRRVRHVAANPRDKREWDESALEQVGA